MTKKNDITKDGNVKKETTIYKDGKLAFQDIEKYEDGDLVRAETKEYDDGRLVYEYNYDSMFGTEYEEWHTYGEDGRKDSEYTINTDQHHKTVTYTAYENDKKDVSVGFEYGTHASYDGKVGGVGFKTYEYLENGEGLWREYRLGLSHEYNRKGEDIVFNSDQNEKLKYVRCTKFERLGADRYRSIDSTEHGDSKESRAKIEKLMDEKEITTINSLYGKDSIDKLKKEKYELIIIDDELNNESGLNLLKQIREENIKLPAIVLLKKEKEFIEKHYIEDGFNDAIIKENIDEQINKLDKYL